MKTENQLLREALKKIANWPDGGNRYGQEKIKAFASQVLTAQPAEGGELVRVLKRDQKQMVHGISDEQRAEFNRSFASLEQAVIIELAGVHDAIKEKRGFWRSCSGCHELNEGHDTGPYSKVFGCALGNGCSECGGLGAIWDNTDYEDMARHMMTASHSQAQQPDHFPDAGKMVQQPSGEVPFDTDTLRKAVTRHALQIDEQATLEDFPEALAFQIEMARALLREFGLPATPKPEPMTGAAEGAQQ